MFITDAVIITHHIIDAVITDHIHMHTSCTPGIFRSLPVCNLPLILAKQAYTVSATLVLCFCCFIFRCICWCFLFFCCRGFFLLQGKCAKKVLLHHMQHAGALEDFFTIMKCFCTACEALYTTVHMDPQATSLCRSWRIDFLLAQKYEPLQSNSRLLGCERVMETRAEFHFSWDYTFSATLSSLRNWANNDRYRLRPSTPTQLRYSSRRLQPLQNNNLIIIPAP